MNTHQQHEDSAAITLVRCADGLASAYSQPCDMDAARLALLIVAVELELKTQGINKDNFFTMKEEK